MKLIAKSYDIDVSDPVVLIHDDDCAEIGVKENDRVTISASRSVVGSSASST